MKKLTNTIYTYLFDDESGKKSVSIYGIFMLTIIIVSLVPLTFKNQGALFNVIDKVTVIIFIIDYVLRLITANQKYKKGAKSFLIYPFTPFAIIDLISILPSFTIMSHGFKLFRILRIVKSLRAFRALKILRYSKTIAIIQKIFVKQKNVLLTVAGFAVGYIIVCALIAFNAEPNTFKSFFEAIYWATLSLTTVGYGDIFPVTTAGRLISMVSSFVGVAIIALPSCIITAGYLEEINEEREIEKEKNEEENNIE